jgi:hypothetical protein
LGCIRQKLFLREQGVQQGIKAEAYLAQAMKEHARANQAAKDVMAQAGRYAKLASPP